MKRFPDTEDIRATLQLLSLEGEDFDPSSFENAILLGGKYAVNRILACEGQGTIVVATDPVLQREVVLKIYHRADSEQDLIRIMNEGRALANIESPHVVKCFGVEELDQEYFLVIEYVDGDTLDQWRDQSHPSIREIIEKFRQLVLAIEAVHDQGLLHLDLSPSNAVVNHDGQLKLIDFGLVQCQTSEFAVDGSSGTTAFMAPEVANSGDDCQPNERTDIFGLGSILYFLLSGYAPFEAKSSTESRKLAAKGDIAPIQVRCPDLPEAISSLCTKCLRKDPELRFQSAKSLLAELDANHHTWSPLAPIRAACFVAALFLSICMIGLVLDPQNDTIAEQLEEFNQSRTMAEKGALANNWDQAVRNQYRVVEKAKHPYFKDSHLKQELSRWEAFKKIKSNFNKSEQTLIANAFNTLKSTYRGDQTDVQKAIAAGKVYDDLFDEPNAFTSQKDLYLTMSLTASRDKDAFVQELSSLSKVAEANYGLESSLNTYILSQIAQTQIAAGEIKKGIATTDKLIKSLENSKGYSAFRRIDFMLANAVTKHSIQPIESKETVAQILAESKIELDPIQKYDLGTLLCIQEDFPNCIETVTPLVPKLAEMSRQPFSRFWIRMCHAYLFRSHANICSTQTGNEKEKHLNLAQEHFYKLADYENVFGGRNVMASELELMLARGWSDLGDSVKALNYVDRAVNRLKQLDDNHLQLTSALIVLLPIAEANENAKIVKQATNQLLKSVDASKENLDLHLLANTYLVLLENRSQISTDELKELTEASRQLIAEQMQTDVPNREAWQLYKSRFDKLQSNE